MSTAIKVHSLPFLDHDENNRFAIYATSPENTSTGSLGVIELLQALNTSRYAPETTSYRLGIWFPPRASVEECERYYNAEKSARGTYTDQLREIRDGQRRREEDNPRRGSERLFGARPLVLRPPSFCHDDMLFIIDRPAGWRDGANVRMVEFRPAEVPGEFEPDPEELEEAPEIVAPTRVRAFPVCLDPEAYDGAGTVQGRMYEVFLIKEEQLSGPYERALELGWTAL